MHRSHAIAAALLLMLALAPQPATAAGAVPDPDMLTPSFLAAHPDIDFRRRGLEAYEAGRHAAALDAFEEAARWSDKLSAAMVAEMYWNGTGAPVDRALAQAWAEIAAERGFPRLVALRDRYWAALEDTERARARELLPTLLEQYGDAVAMERLADRLGPRLHASRDSRDTSGGSRGALHVYVPTARGWKRFSGHTYYNRKFWDPARYGEWQAEEANRPIPRVEVAEPVAAPDAAAATGQD